MLAKRLLTAFIMLSIFLLSLSLDNKIYFISLFTFCVSMVFLEWMQFFLEKKYNNYLYIFSLIIFIFLIFFSDFLFQNLYIKNTRLFKFLIYSVVLVWVSFAAISIIFYRDFSSLEKKFWLFFSIPACFSAWCAFIFFYKIYGDWFIISLLMPVWILDTSGYIFGKYIGRTKLIPKVSPGKTLEGAVFGIFFSVLFYIVSSSFKGSFASLILEKYSIFVSLFLFFFLSMIAILGDLFESLLKRNFGIKDSGFLLPGHGGFFDRLDSLIPFIPTAIILSGVIN
ncbi:MAG: CDP-archaeol synthase [Candidatus Kinetoplastibacterium crithidii]|nr:MAG: CDP-archaeol synthase [Candidatus Kinetoplastibacterium crithidii]